jgi:hypothetical protein
MKDSLSASTDLSLIYPFRDAAHGAAYYLVQSVLGCATDFRVNITMEPTTLGIDA